VRLVEIGRYRPGGGCHLSGRDGSVGHERGPVWRCVGGLRHRGRSVGAVQATVGPVAEAQVVRVAQSDVEQLVEYRRCRVAAQPLQQGALAAAQSTHLTAIAREHSAFN